MNLATKGDILILKNGDEIFFSHWVNKHGNGGYFIDIKGNKYNITDLA